MKRSRYTEEQIAFALKQAELGTPVPEVCRKMGVSDATFYNWRAKYGGMEVSQVKRLKELEDEKHLPPQKVSLADPRGGGLARRRGADASTRRSMSAWAVSLRTVSASAAFTSFSTAEHRCCVCVLHTVSARAPRYATKRGCCCLSPRSSALSWVVTLATSDAT